MRIHSFAVGLLTATLASQVLPGQVWAVDVPTPANAADTYRKAFEVISRTSLANSAPFQQDLRTVPLTDETKSLLTANQEAVDLVHKAASEPAANWGDTSDINAVLKQLNPVRTTSHLMTLHARTALADKNPDAAVDDWLATIAMARRVGQMNLVVSRLVATAVEAQAIDQATAELPNLPEPAKKRLSDGWAKLPKPPTGHDLLMGEYAYAKQAIVKQGMNKEWVTVLEPFYKTIAAAADGPADQFNNVVDQQAAKFKLNPFAQTIAPSLKRSYASLAQLTAKRTALESALLPKA